MGHPPGWSWLGGWRLLRAELLQEEPSGNLADDEISQSWARFLGRKPIGFNGAYFQEDRIADVRSGRSGSRPLLAPGFCRP